MRKFCTLRAPRGLATDPTIAGGQAGWAPPVVTAPIQSVLDLRVPKELKKVLIGHEKNTISVGQLWKLYADMVQSSCGNPGAIMHAVRQYMQTEDNLDVKFLTAALAELGSSFDPNSFWAAGDKQILTSNQYFKFLVADLIEGKHQIDSSQAPLILYSLAALEYRPARLMDALIIKTRSDLPKYKLETLANLAWSISSLNVADVAIINEIFDQAKLRFGDYPETGSLHDWAQLAFACTVKGEYSRGIEIFLQNACMHLRTTAQLDRAGWAQFWLYQSLYATDVEGPENAEKIRKAVPQWIQERLHYRWLDGILTTCQPQGADLLQLDVDAALKRTNTQALINCSASREQDDKPCWFMGHKLSPKIALEYNSQLPTVEGSFRLSGWLELKKRILQKLGYSVVVINDLTWSKLTESQKDEQMLLLRAQLGYVHDPSLESKRPSQAVPKKRGENVKTVKPGAVRWEDQPDWEPHLREPELEFTVHGYKPKDNPNFKGGVQVNKRRKFIANGTQNWVNSLAPKG